MDMFNGLTGILDTRGRSSSEEKDGLTCLIIQKYTLTWFISDEGLEVVSGAGGTVAAGVHLW